ncbi:hypothetical protein BIY23_01385 [Wolbachia pipientis]|uniref:Uncharacterized protein n=1 Tax=Wolbachia pipientis TaxID=955 RepID=A0A1E7QLM5_WOLPI|nr:hypothetical protein [Wolbachia pipientis]OEY87119.1 hypothetical protein BIY23_01385 [Wolbachia pipientis]
MNYLIAEQISINNDFNNVVNVIRGSALSQKIKKLINYINSCKNEDEKSLEQLKTNANPILNEINNDIVNLTQNTAEQCLVQAVNMILQNFDVLLSDAYLYNRYVNLQNNASDVRSNQSNSAKQSVSSRSTMLIAFLSSLVIGIIAAVVLESMGNRLQQRL